MMRPSKWIFLFDMPDYFSIDQASEELKVPRRYLESYIKVGQELSMERVGRRKLISSTELERWKRQRQFGLVILGRSDYVVCLEFAIRSFYSYRSTSDFGTSTQRDAGKFISNFAIGKLGELAVKKFLKRRFDLDIELDFALRESVVGQDITELARPRKGGRVFNPLRKRVAIKTSKMKNVWLVVPEKEVTDADRTSDIYIFSRSDLFQDHLIRLLRDHNSLENLNEIIPPFEDIPTEVCGFTYFDALAAVPPVKELPIQKQAIGSSYIMNTGALSKDRLSWETMLASL
jgi:excisionase family DNA binding protein